MLKNPFAKARKFSEIHKFHKQKNFANRTFKVAAKSIFQQQKNFFIIQQSNVYSKFITFNLRPKFLTGALVQISAGKGHSENVLVFWRLYSKTR